MSQDLLEALAPLSAVEILDANVVSSEELRRRANVSARYGAATDSPHYLTNGEILPPCPICFVEAGAWCHTKDQKKCGLHKTRFR